jgi:hypothetical protein
MVVAAKNSISAEVLAPLDAQGWAVSSVFRALWGGDRNFPMSGSTGQLIDVALGEHPYKTVSSLPFAFPFVYAETLAINTACAGASHVVETQKVLELIRAERQSGATFRLLSRCAENPATFGGEGMYAEQVAQVLAHATSLKTQKRYSPEVKHYVAAQYRRQHRCLCLCTAHLASQSRKLLHERSSAGKAKAENPFQRDIDKLVCVALSIKPNIGAIVAALFEHPTYQLPPCSGLEVDYKMFHGDLAILLEQVCRRFVAQGVACVLTLLQADGALETCFNTHLRWLLDAASGAISLAQSMLLDAASADPFAQALIDRAACLRNPLIAAAQTGSLIGLVSLKEEKEAIKQHVSDFDGLGTALDRL